MSGHPFPQRRGVLLWEVGCWGRPAPRRGPAADHEFYIAAPGCTTCMQCQSPHDEEDGAYDDLIARDGTFAAGCRRSSPTAASGPMRRSFGVSKSGAT